MSTLNDFLTNTVERLTPVGDEVRESDKAYRVRCPNPNCVGSPEFLLFKQDGSGECLAEPLPIGGYRSYSPREIAEALGIPEPDSAGAAGSPSDTQSSGKAQATTTETSGSRSSRADTLNEEAEDLLRNPRLLDGLTELAESQGIAGDQNLLRTLFLIVTGGRLLSGQRLHASIGGQSAAGKSTVAKFVLAMLPKNTVVHLGGGMSAKALQYAKGLSHCVTFIDEAESLPDEAKALLREGMTSDQVTRLVTKGDAASGFTSSTYTVLTKNMVIVQAGTHVIANPADQTRVLQLYPDESAAQTGRILDAQAAAAAQTGSEAQSELATWRWAQTFLEPCRVIVPFAHQLRAFFPDNEIRVRRDYPRIISLIAAHACLHQKQRVSWYEGDLLVLEAEPQDYEGVHRLAEAILDQSTKGLTPAQEKVLSSLQHIYGEGGEFSTKQAQVATNLALSTVKDHLQKLEKLGLIERSWDRMQNRWRIIGDAPTGLHLPSPDRLFRRTPVQQATATRIAPKLEPSAAPAVPAGSDSEAIEEERWTYKDS